MYVKMCNRAGDVYNMTSVLAITCKCIFSELYDIVQSVALCLKESLIVVT